MKFILASKSPRRKELLGNLGLKFEIMESSADESVISKDIPPEIYVQELAMIKSTSVAACAEKNSLVIGADTVVVADGKIIGKPKNFDEAFSMLSSFSNSSHKVYSGISVTDSSSGRTVADWCETEVFFNEMTPCEIENYINTYKPYDKAGAYGIQEYASVFIEKINGDFFNVVGLPLSKLYGLLKKEFDVVL
ncbi:MAG: septum formation protein Maf [Clostridia bacterium]|nr:septum formation protein Maf [Clostridia bacterium]